MPILYALHRDGHPTGTVRKVASPHELSGRTPQLTRKRQSTQQRLISTLDRSEKWVRTTEPVAPVVDEALVEQRVAERLAELRQAEEAEQAAEAASPKATTARTRKAKPAEGPDETPAA